MNMDARLENLLEIVTKTVEVADKNTNDISDLIAIVRKHDSEIIALRRDLAKTIDSLKDR